MHHLYCYIYIMSGLLLKKDRGWEVREHSSELSLGRRSGAQDRSMHGSIDIHFRFVTIELVAATPAYRIVLVSYTSRHMPTQQSPHQSKPIDPIL
jgi:hypothetical protein